jgi:hypothetical protein
MTTREEIENELEKVFDKHFIKLWWSLNLPGLGNSKPIEVIDQNPDMLLDYVKAYSNQGIDVDAGGTE